MDEFDPWAFDSATIDVAPWAGPQSDGTYVTPSTAQQINSPDNTAGFGSSMSTQTYNLLAQGITAAGNLFALDKMIDYRKYEATNGGLFMQGQGAYAYRAGQVVNPNMTMMLLLFAGIVFMMKD